MQQLKVGTENRVLVSRCQATFQGEIGTTEAKKCGKLYQWSILMALQKCLPKVHDYTFMCKIAVKTIIAERKQAFILKCI